MRSRGSTFFEGFEYSSRILRLCTLLAYATSGFQSQGITRRARANYLADWYYLQVSMMAVLPARPSLIDSRSIESHFSTYLFVP